MAHLMMSGSDQVNWYEPVVSGETELSFPEIWYIMIMKGHINLRK